MNLVTRSAHHAGEVVGRVLGRAAAVIVGFVMIILGVGMTATIVMLPAGIVTLLLGVLVFIGGIFAPQDRSEA